MKSRVDMRGVSFLAEIYPPPARRVKAEAPHRRLAAAPSLTSGGPAGRMPSAYDGARGGNLTVDRTGLVSRRRFLWRAGLLGGGVALASVFGCRSGGERPLTTLDRTIVLGADGVLRIGPGEPHQVRTDLAQAQVGREKRRRSLVVFHHFGDAQILDEESPLRGEWQGSCPTPLSTAAFRPQETLTAQV